MTPNEIKSEFIKLYGGDKSDYSVLEMDELFSITSDYLFYQFFQELSFPFQAIFHICSKQHQFF